MLATVVLLSGLGAIARAAYAHAELVSAEPAPGAIVSPDLSEIRLTFSETLGGGSTVVLFASGFQAVGGIVPAIDGSTLVARLPAALAPGTYTVQWTAASPDGHGAEGSYQFGVAESTGGSQSPELWWLAGLALAAVVLVAAGAAIFRTVRHHGTPQE